PDTDVEGLAAVLGIRFRVEVRHDDVNGVDWSAGGLRRAWGALASLPDVHMGISNPSLGWLARRGYVGSTGAGGEYDGDKAKASITYSDDKLGVPNDKADKHDPLYGVNRFDKVVRHEVGHSVDQQIGAHEKYCVNNKHGGDWRKFPGGVGLA